MNCNNNNTSKIFTTEHPELNILNTHLVPLAPKRRTTDKVPARTNNAADSACSSASITGYYRQYRQVLYPHVIAKIATILLALMGK
ncbi:hypothetical protein M422DRAFT_266548 [Sphaerobolus stellatus SS14]|uniref:Uncharacterized protein n=1 Tax=Sphaerobolus stellatus (strain SS14) TaxID=990650 RepID=A0A0C9TP34_SPHS4|nr:hypothetical protein M422DRAFT_266548 [Sphaerobolus stellatus SS14]